MKNNYRTWIGLPAFNEEKAIKNVLISITKLKLNNIRVILFNDGSSDKTIDNCKQFEKRLRLNIIDNKQNQGLGVAVYSIMKFFKKKSNNNDKLVLMDCDNTHNPNQILQMIQKGNKKKNIVIIASRFQKRSKVINVPFIRNLLSYTAFFIFNILFKTKGVKDFTSGYRLYDKAVINNFFSIVGLKYKPASGFEMQLEIILQLRKINTYFSEIPIFLDYKKKFTKSKMKIIKTIFNYLKLIFFKIYK